MNLSTVACRAQHFARMNFTASDSSTVNLVGSSPPRLTLPGLRPVFFWHGPKRHHNSSLVVPFDRGAPHNKKDQIELRSFFLWGVGNLRLSRSPTLAKQS